MKSSPSFVGLRWFTMAVMVLLLSTGNLQLIKAQRQRCDPVEISWCLQSIVSNMPPSSECCQKFRGQGPCLCRDMRDQTIGGYLRLPGARRVAAACGVTFPNCR